MAKTYTGNEMNAGAVEALAKIPDGEPFALINLLRYKEWAEYPPGTESEKVTGRQAYERYSELSMPLVNEVGGVPMWRGDSSVNLIGPEDENWDEVLILQYPSRSAFEQMFGSPEFQAIVFHRTAAICRMSGRVICMSWSLRAAPSDN